MFDLRGKVTLVAGGAGEVGEGIVRVFLQSGATVVVPSRSEQRLADLRRRVAPTDSDRLVTMVVSVGTHQGAVAVRDAIAHQVGPLDAVVASLGGWWQGKPLVDVPLDAWQRVLDGGLTTHFNVARTFLPLLADRPGASYTFINGGAAEFPAALAGPVSIVAAAQLMMKNVLAEEMQDRQVRINTLLLNTPILTRSRPQGEPEWLTANEAGLYAAYLASERGADVRGKTIRLYQRAQLAPILAAVGPQQGPP